MTKIKICGITNIDDALWAAKCGADALGFVFAKSPRSISAARVKKIIAALPPFITKVGVFVNENASTVNSIAQYCGLDRVQLHGDESPEFCKKIKYPVIKAFRIKSEKDLKAIRKYKGISAVLLDTFSNESFGGTGKRFDWALAVKAKSYFRGPLILSGGLKPENLKEAVARVSPYAVDMSSGVEKAPGKKDGKKVKKAVEIVKCGCIIQ